MFSSDDDDLISAEEWLIVDAFRETYELAVERFVNEVPAAADASWPAVGTALIQLNDVYRWMGQLLEGRRSRRDAVALELSHELERVLAGERK